jgi:ubiquinone/menaquinone biosynthesis C-methylase UbiE
METRTANFFDQYAGDFSAIYGNDHTPVNAVVNKLFRKSMMLRYERSLAGCEPIQGKTVIDIGCGPGHYGVALAQRGAARVLGVDFAPGMIDIAKKRAERAGVTDRCTFTLGDFLEVTGEEQFDYAIVMGFMDYIEDPLALMKKVIKVCRRRDPRLAATHAVQEPLRSLPLHRVPDPLARVAVASQGVERRADKPRFLCDTHGLSFAATASSSSVAQRSLTRRFEK